MIKALLDGGAFFSCGCFALFHHAAVRLRFPAVGRLDRTGPDEFAVELRAPLTIPPDFELRPPAPGASRPQEVTAAERARKAIDTAGAGEPGKQASAGLRIPQGGPRRAETPNSQQAVEQTMSDKLLGYSAQQGGAEKRETTTVKGVY